MEIKLYIMLLNRHCFQLSKFLILYYISIDHCLRKLVALTAELTSFIKYYSNIFSAEI